MTIDMTVINPMTEVAVKRIFLSARVFRTLASVSFFVIIFERFDIGSKPLPLAIGCGLIFLAEYFGKAAFWVWTLVAATVFSSMKTAVWGRRTVWTQKEFGKRAFRLMDLRITRYRISRFWILVVFVSCGALMFTGWTSLPFLIALAGIIFELVQTKRRLSELDNLA